MLNITEIHWGLEANLQEFVDPYPYDSFINGAQILWRYVLIPLERKLASSKKLGCASN